VISSFRRDIDEIWAFQGYYAASSIDPLPTFRENISVRSSRVRKSKRLRGPWFSKRLWRLEGKNATVSSPVPLKTLVVTPGGLQAIILGYLIFSIFSKQISMAFLKT
jgi:hypothetical protein